MTTWNYRVAMRTTIDVHGAESVNFVLVEAYYDHDQDPDDRPDAITVEPSYPYGESVPALLDDYLHMEQAFTRPVIDEADYFTETENSDAMILRP